MGGPVIDKTQSKRRITMKAHVYHGPRKRALEDKPKPVIKAPTENGLCALRLPLGQRQASKPTLASQLTRKNVPEP
jgi:hypothetical protein